MDITKKQLHKIDTRMEYTCVTNATTMNVRPNQHSVNIRAAIRMAFVLGVRFGIVYPTMSSDYMERWLNEYTNDPDTAALRHQTAMEQAIWPLTHEDDDD